MQLFPLSIPWKGRESESSLMVKFETGKEVVKIRFLSVLVLVSPLLNIFNNLDEELKKLGTRI